MLVSQTFASGTGNQLLTIPPADTPMVGDTLVAVVNVIGGNSALTCRGGGCTDWTDTTAFEGGNEATIWVGTVTSTPASPTVKIQGAAGDIKVILAHFNDCVATPVDQAGTQYAARGNGDLTTGFPSMLPTLANELLIATCAASGSLGNNTMPNGWIDFNDTTSTFAAGYYVQDAIAPIDSSGFGWDLTSGRSNVAAVTLVQNYVPPDPVTAAYIKFGNFGWAGGGKNGATVDMWLASRFSTAPSQGTPAPAGDPDAGPVTTGTEFGGPGSFAVVVPTIDDYFVRVQYGGFTYWSACPSGSILGNPGGGGGGGAVDSVFGRVGVVTAQAGDYTPGEVGALDPALNLSDVDSASSARTNLGLGTAATSDTTAFDTAGAAAAAQAAAQGSSVQKAGDTMTGPLTLPGNPSSTLQAATKGYVDASSTGLIIKNPVVCATAAALPTNTYNNGASGVGATLTGSATGVLTVDGHAVVLNDRVLVKNETAGANNGIYTCTTAGAVGVAYVLTRAGDNDQSSEFDNAYCFVSSGTSNGGSSYVCINTTPPIVGTTTISWTLFANGTTYSADGTTITLTGSQFSVTPSVFTKAANNLSDVASAPTALTNLGALAKANNLSDLSSAATARTNLGAGSVNGLAQLDGSGFVPIAQLPITSATSIRPTTGAPIVLATDQAGDFACDTTGLFLYGPYSGAGSLGSPWGAIAVDLSGGGGGGGGAGNVLNACTQFGSNNIDNTGTVADNSTNLNAILVTAAMLGCDVFIPSQSSGAPGIVKIQNPIVFGNGSSAAQSSIPGCRLLGAGHVDGSTVVTGGAAAISGKDQYGQTIIQWNGPASTPSCKVTTPNVSLNSSTTVTLTFTGAVDASYGTSGTATYSDVSTGVDYSFTYTGRSGSTLTGCKLVSGGPVTTAFGDRVGIQYAMCVIQGPIQGVGFKNITFDGGSTMATQPIRAILNYAGQFTLYEDCAFYHVSCGIHEVGRTYNGTSGQTADCIWSRGNRLWFHLPTNGIGPSLNQSGTICTAGTYGTVNSAGLNVGIIHDGQVPGTAGNTNTCFGDWSDIWMSADATAYNTNFGVIFAGSDTIRYRNVVPNPSGSYASDSYGGRASFVVYNNSGYPSVESHVVEGIDFGGNTKTAVTTISAISPITLGATAMSASGSAITVTATAPTKWDGSAGTWSVNSWVNIAGTITGGTGNWSSVLGCYQITSGSGSSFTFTAPISSGALSGTPTTSSVTVVPSNSSSYPVQFRNLAMNNGYHAIPQKVGIKWEAPFSGGIVTAPSIPGSGTTFAAQNNTSSNVMANIVAGGAISDITLVPPSSISQSTLPGGSTGMTLAANASLAVRVPFGWSIRLTWAGASPSWTWFAD